MTLALFSSESLVIQKNRPTFSERDDLTVIFVRCVTTRGRRGRVHGVGLFKSIYVDCKRECDGAQHS
jgi:hypothetical protein